MSYRRVLLIVELGSAPAPAAAAIRRLAPDAERLLVLARASGRDIAMHAHDARGAGDPAASLGALRAAVAPLAGNVETMFAEELGADALALLAEGAGIDLVAAAGLPAGTIPLLAGLRKRLSLPSLWIGVAPAGDGPLREVACAAFGARARGALASFLREHGNPALRCTILGPRIPDARLAEALSVAGIAARVEFASLGTARFAAPDLFVEPLFPAAVLAISTRRAPVLVLPPVAAIRAPRRRIDAADAAELGRALRVRVTYETGVGRLEPLPDQEIAFVARGRTAWKSVSREGFVEVEGDGAESFGLSRTAEAPGADPVAAVEQRIAVVRPGARALALFDADLPDDDLACLTRTAPDGLDLLAVRLRPVRSCAFLRARLASRGLAEVVLDAGAVLEEGPGLDVPPEADPVRLARIAERMRGAGYPVAAVVHAGLHTPRTAGFPAVRAGELAAALPTSLAAAPTVMAPGTIPGNRIDLEVDNPTARGWLLDALARAEERFHFQVYMALDDDVASEVESALAAAAARGVTVRVVVDSLHGLHGSFGLTNPLLARLGARPNVELRLARPVTGAPSVEALKQRDHRKLAIVDGRVALVGGRNLSHEYYAGFDEVPLGPSSLWREVPWLDAGARVEGPAVEALERSFLDAWTEAGGAPFEIRPQPPAGRAAARVVVHRGLRDAATLDAYRDLIDSARHRVWIVNGFPLLLELRNALLCAAARGVDVDVVVGHTTPTHEDTPFRGPWSTARQAASELVASRLDALVDAGARVYRLAVPRRPGWAPELGTVHPHVHAKVVCVDGRVCSVGSANLDVTAAYWEDEVVLVVEDESVAGALESRLEEIAGRSERIGRDDPARRAAARRSTGGPSSIRARPWITRSRRST